MEYKDLMNETLLVAYEKLGTFQSEKAFLSFLFTISVRILANSHRKKKTDSFPSQEKMNTFSDVNANTELEAEVYLLHKALALLSEEQREALILFEISGFSIKEVAVIQSASISALKQRLKRGRVKLTESLTFESVYKTGEVNYEK